MTAALKCLANICQSNIMDYAKQGLIFSFLTVFAATHSSQQTSAGVKSAWEVKIKN